MISRRAMIASIVPARAVFGKDREAILTAMQKVMGPLPRMTAKPPRIRELGVETFPGYTRRRIDFETEPGDWVSAFLLVPSKKERMPAAVCLHQTTKIGKAEPAGEGPNANLHYAAELADRGFVAIAPDYPGYGDYRIDVYERGYVSATMKGIVNHMRAVSLLASLPDVAPQRIGAIGHSLGGHNTLFLAAFDPRIRACATSCGFTSFARYKGGDLSGWTHRGYMPRIATIYEKSPSKMPFDFPDVLAAIAPRAVFINAPLHDSNFDVEGVRDCVRIASPHFPEGQVVARYPDAGHDFPSEVRAEAHMFLETNV